MTYACRVCGALSPTPRCPTHTAGRRPRGNAYEPTRQAVATRDDWACMICGDPINPKLKRPHPMALHVDHIVARSQGGSDDASQLRATHAVCNLRKGANAA